MADPQVPATETLYSPSGEQVQVPLADVPAALRSGGLTVREDQVLYVENPAAPGTVKPLVGQDAVDYYGDLRHAGMRAGSADEFGQQLRQEEYSGAGAGAQALAAGAARGLTFGGSDYLLSQLDGGRERLAGLKEFHPGLSLGGEVAGIALPALFSGGATAGARGAVAAGGAVRGGGALARGAEALGAVGRVTGAPGALAERGASALAGAVGLAEAGAASRVAAGAARGLAEGALYGAGQAVSDASIKGDPLTVDKLFAAAQHGGGLGAAVGGALPGLGALLRAGAAKTAEGVTSAVAKVEERLAAKEAEVAGRLEAAVPKGESTLKALASRVEREQVLAATGATPKQLGKLAREPELEGVVVKQYAEELPALAGKKEGALLSRPEKLAAAEKLVAQKGKQVGELVDALERSGAKVDNLAVYKTGREQLEKLAQQAGSRAQVDALRSFVEDLDAKLVGGGAKELWSQKKFLGQAIKGKGVEESALREAKREIFWSLDKELTRMGDGAAAELGEGFAARWRLANREYRGARWLEDATRRGAETGAGRLGLSDKLTAVGAGLVAGGGPLGAAAGLGTALLTQAVKPVAHDIAANLARGIVRGDALSRVVRMVDDRVGGRVAALTKTAAETAKRLPGPAPVAVTLEGASHASKERKTMAAQYAERRERLARSQALDARPARDALAGIASTHPEIASALVAKQKAADAYLASKAPPSSRAGLGAQVDERERVAPAAMSKWLRYAKGVDDPIGVLDDAADGVASRESVEALKAVYPDLYSELSDRVALAVAQASAEGKTYSYQERVSLKLVFGVDSDPSLDPRFIQRYQASIHAPARENTQTVAPPTRPINTTKLLQPEAEPL